jgi:hypothetical protein
MAVEHGEYRGRKEKRRRGKKENYIGCLIVEDDFQKTSTKK